MERGSRRLFATAPRLDRRRARQRGRVADCRLQRVL